MKTKKLILNVLFVFSPLALGNHSQPNVMLVEKVEDRLSATAPNGFYLQRTYQSRSLHKGFLGYGWCLRFEKVLIPQTSGKVDYYNCDSDRPVRFELQRHDGDDLIYSSMNAPGFSLVKTSRYWTITDSEWNTWTFDSGGRLKRWTLSGQEFSLERHRDGALRMLLGPFGRVRVRQNPNTLLIQSLQYQNNVIHFTYKDFLLTSVKTPYTSWNYLYDSARNLSKITKNNQVQKTISYNIGKDQVERLVASSFVVSLNPAGQIASMEHASKGRLVFHYGPEGQLLSLQSNNRVVAVNDIKHLSLPGFKHRLFDYLNVASQVLKNLQSL